MPNLTDQEKAELINWFRTLEDNEDRKAKNLQKMEVLWEQNRAYHQDRFLYSDRL